MNLEFQYKKLTYFLKISLLTRLLFQPKNEINKKFKDQLNKKKTKNNRQCTLNICNNIASIFVRLPVKNFWICKELTDKYIINTLMTG